MVFKKPGAQAGSDPFRDRYKSVRYRPVSKRRRLLIVLLALATAATLLLYILGRRGAILSGKRPVPADVSACRGGNTSACVGGTVTVIMAPAPAGSASAP
jgi:hypothetical protein